MLLQCKTFLPPINITHKYNDLHFFFLTSFSNTTTHFNNFFHWIHKKKTFFLNNRKGNFCKLQEKFLEGIYFRKILPQDSLSNILRVLFFFFLFLVVSSTVNRNIAYNFCYVMNDEYLYER